MVLPLVARALEAREQDPILVDPRAQEILTSLAVDTRDLETREHRLWQIGHCIASAIIDGWIRDFLREHPAGIVVEIAPGLDGRFDRVDNGQVQWFEVEPAAALAKRREFYAETDRRRMIEASAFDPDWTLAVPNAEPVMVVAQGFLFYFSEEQVRSLYQMIADRFPGARFAHDSCTRGIAKSSPKLALCRLSGTSYEWGIDDIHEVESWDDRYKVLSVDSAMNHHRRRYDWPVRFVTWLVPAIRRAFTVNLVQLGTPA